MKIIQWMALALLATPSAIMAADSELDDWYIGFGLGSSNAYYKYKGTKITFEEWFEGADNYRHPAITFRVGGQTSNPKLYVGADITSSFATGSVPGVSARLSITNIFAVVTYFPNGKGLFLRGGGGLSSIRLEGETAYSGDTDETYDGTGVLVGIGYLLKTGKSFGMSANLDFTRNNFEGGDGPDSGGSTLLYLGFDWY